MNPATNSDSASGKSNGTLLVSAKIVIINKTNRKIKHNDVSINLINNTDEILNEIIECLIINISVKDIESFVKIIINIIDVEINSNEINCEINLIAPNIEYLELPEKLAKTMNITAIEFIINKTNKLNDRSMMKNGNIKSYKNKENNKKLRGKRWNPIPTKDFGIKFWAINRFTPFIIDAISPYCPILNGPILLWAADIISSSSKIK